MNRYANIERAGIHIFDAKEESRPYMERNPIFAELCKAKGRRRKREEKSEKEGNYEVICIKYTSKEYQKTERYQRAYHDIQAAAAEISFLSSDYIGEEDEKEFQKEVRRNVKEYCMYMTFKIAAMMEVREESKRKKGE